MKPQSLQRSLLLPIASISVLSMLLLGLALEQALNVRLERNAKADAEMIAHMIGYAAESVTSITEVNRIVSAAGSERNVDQILIVAGDPFEVLASTRRDLLGVRAADLPADLARDALLAAVARREVSAQLDPQSYRYRYILPIVIARPEVEGVVSLKGAVLVRLNLQKYYAELRKSTNISLANRVILLLATMVAIFLLIRHHALQPMATVQRAIHRYANGELSARAPVQGPLELQSLASSLNGSFDAVEKGRLGLLAAEEFTRSVLDHIPTMVSVKDADGRYVLVNQARAQFFGESADHMIGLIETRLVASRDRDKAVLTGKVALDATEEHVIDRGGHARWLQTSRRRLPSEDRRGLLLTVSYETTERRRILEELKLAKNASDAASRAKSEFLATMSHEIRTPMNGVLGFSEILLQSPLNDDQRSCVETIHSSGQNLLIIINDILDFSKIEAGKLALDRKPFDLSAVVAEVAALIQPQCTAKGIELTVEYAADCLRIVEADANRTRQVLLNLAGNAVKFTSQGSVAIDVRSDGEPGVIISVSDTGIGVAEVDRKRLFQKFFQVDSTTTRRFGGTGLGLAISKQLIELMGGTIGADSVHGQGSRFWFRLPTARVQDSHMTTTPPSAVPATLPHASLNTAHPVLLVEDHPVNMMLAKRFIEKLGLTVECAPNGLVAVERAAERQYSMIFMDCHMPELDGFAATEAIRRHDRELGRYTPVIAITASAMQADRDRCFAVGMDEFLSKPVSAARIREIVEKVMARSGAAPADTSAATSPAEPDRAASSRS